MVELGHALPQEIFHKILQFRDISFCTALKISSAVKDSSRFRQSSAHDTSSYNCTKM